MTTASDQSVPQFHRFFRPSLTVLADGQPHRAADLVTEVADQMGLSPEQRAEVIPSGQGRVRNRVLWSLSYLSQAKAVERPARGTYKITERGRDLLAKQPNTISVDDLREYPEFREFQARSNPSTGGATTAPDSGAVTPLEQISTAVALLEAATATDLVERLRDQPFEFLEKVVLRLLVAMGYGGDADVQHLGGPHDGGFDGVINQDALGLERVYVQAKRYGADNIVGRPAVQAFVGALHGMGAAGGVFITTSRFTPEALAFASTINPRVILIDGVRLGELLVKYRVGVQEREVFTIVETDEDFFE